MKKLIALCILTLSGATSPAQNLKFGKPTEEEMNMTVYAKDSEAPAVVLCNLTTVDYTIDLHDYLVDYNVKMRIKILKDEGKEYANIQIPYIYNTQEQYAQESIEDFKATAYNLENGKIVKTKIGKEGLFTERIDEDNMVAKVAVPQVKAGTVIEYEYKRHSNVFYHIHDWNAQEEIPVEFAKYRLEIPVLFLFNVETNSIQPLESQVTAGTISYRATTNNMSNRSTLKTNVYTCIGRDLRAMKKDDYIWNVHDYSTKVTAELKTINITTTYSRDLRKKWEQIDDVLLSHSELGARLNNHSKYREELTASGISEMTDLKEKVAAVYKLLRQKVAWNGEYDLLTHSASEVIKKGNGTNADLNMMLINMLNDVGIKAVPVVMSTRKHGRLPQTYPSLNKLNTFIVGIPNNGSWIYLDASSTDGYLNVLSPNLYTDRARIIQKGAASQWVDLQKIGEGRTQVSVRGSISPDGVLKGTQTVTYSGNAAADERKAFRQAVDSATFVTEKATREKIKITKCQMTGHRDFCPNLQEVIDFTRQGDVTADHIYINPFTEIPITTNPFLEADRLLPVEFPYKQTYSMSIKLAIPEGWELEEMPKSIKISTQDNSITGHILCEVTDENMVAIQYQFRLSRISYTHSQYETLKQLFELFASRSKDMLVFKVQGK